EPGEMRFTEEERQPPVDEGRDFLLALLAAPPMPNAELKKAASEYRRRQACLDQRLGLGVGSRQRRRPRLVGLPNIRQLFLHRRVVAWLHAEASGAAGEVTQLAGVAE